MRLQQAVAATSFKSCASLYDAIEYLTTVRLVCASHQSMQVNVTLLQLTGSVLTAPELHSTRCLLLLICTNAQVMHELYALLQSPSSRRHGHALRLRPPPNKHSKAPPRLNTAPPNQVCTPL